MFNPKEFPITVQVPWQKGSSHWMSIVETAITGRITNVNALTDLAFYYHHKNLIGVCLTGADIDLVAQWKAFRDMIAARVRRVPIKGGQGSDYIWNPVNGASGQTRTSNLEMASWHEAIRNSASMGSLGLGAIADKRTRIPTTYTFNLPKRV